MKKLMPLILAALSLGGCSAYTDVHESFERKCSGLEDAIVIPNGKALYQLDDGIVLMKDIDLNEEPISYNHFFFTGEGGYEKGEPDSFEFIVISEGKTYKADTRLLKQVSPLDVILETNAQKKEAVEMLSCYL